MTKSQLGGILYIFPPGDLVIDCKLQMKLYQEHKTFADLSGHMCMV